MVSCFASLFVLYFCGEGDNGLLSFLGEELLHVYEILFTKLRFGLASLLNGISVFVGYLIPKLSSL